MVKLPIAVMVSAIESSKIFRLSQERANLTILNNLKARRALTAPPDPSLIASSTYKTSTV